MNKRLLSLLTPLFFTATCLAQPAIDSTDMPIPGETIERTVVDDLSLIDYETADSNYIWDFSMLDGNVEIADTFIGILNTSLTYIAVFNNPFDQEHKATVASPQPSFQSVPGISIQNMISFYKRTTFYYGQVGYGAEINSIQVPVKFDNADMLYRFPLNFGNVDSSASFYDINIPSFGYNSQERHRVNVVDGWGTLYVPGDTFEVVRVRSDIQIRDSIYVDSLGFGIGFDRNEIEFKWLAKGYHVPVFQVTKRQGGMGGGNEDGLFIDHRPPATGIATADKLQFNVYPNPSRALFNISVPTNDGFNYRISDMSGKLLIAGRSDKAELQLDLSGLKQGCYLLQCYVNGAPCNRLLLLQ
jgi:hypothetical protein